MLECLIKFQLLLIQFLAPTPGKAVKDGPDTWGLLLPPLGERDAVGLLALAWTSPDHCGHLGKPADLNSASPCYFVFQINTFFLNCSYP